MWDRPGAYPERISRRDDGRVVLTFRKPDPSGRTSWISDGVAFLRRPAAVIPPGRVHGGHAAVVALQREMDAGRRQRLVRLGFTADVAAKLSALHTRNFM